MKSYFDTVKHSSKANEKAFARADLVMNVTEDILVAMEAAGITKAQLARKLGKSKAFVSQTLNGSRNMTLNTLSDLCYEIGVSANIDIKQPAKMQNDNVNYSNYDNIYHFDTYGKNRKPTKITHDHLMEITNDIPATDDVLAPVYTRLTCNGH